MQEVPRSHVTISVYNSKLGIGVDKKEESGGLSTGVIIAITLASVAVALIILLVVYNLYKNRKNGNGGVDTVGTVGAVQK